MTGTVPVPRGPSPTIARSNLSLPALATPVIPTATVAKTREPGFDICSPLGMHPLSELPQIISDPYQPPPVKKPEERHHGVDFGYWHYGERDSMLGEPVQAILPGVVVSLLNDKYPYGNMIMIETTREAFPKPLIDELPILAGQSIYHLYAHLQNPPDFTIGEKITSCQPLGEVGESGNTDIPHLHLETRLGPAGQAFESMLFYSTRATQEEMDNYVLWRTSGVFQHFDPLKLLNWGRIGDSIQKH
jgi:murein DD-endopeptidase MepM/ murein hydrolase activator NlpD